MTIRRAELGEVDIVRSIIEEAYKPVKKQLSRPPAALTEGLGKISRHIQMGNVYVAIVGGSIVGTMRVTMRGNIGVIERLAVKNNFRNRRIGSMMVEYAENLLAHMGASYVEIEVYSSVDAQSTFYSRLGYVETGRKERLGEEIILMRKDLAEGEIDEEFE